MYIYKYIYTFWELSIIQQKEYPYTSKMEWERDFEHGLICKVGSYAELLSFKREKVFSWWYYFVLLTCVWRVFFMCFLLICLLLGCCLMAIFLLMFARCFLLVFRQSQVLALNGLQVLSTSPITVMASYLFIIWCLAPALALAVASILPSVAAGLLMVGSYILPWMLYVQMSPGSIGLQHSRELMWPFGFQTDELSMWNKKGQISFELPVLTCHSVHGSKLNTSLAIVV